MDLKITVLPGEGCGPEIMNEALLVLRAIGELYGHDFKFCEKLVGRAAMRQSSVSLPHETVESCLESDAVLLGRSSALADRTLAPLKHSAGWLPALRKALGAYINVLPVVSYKANVDSVSRPEWSEGIDLLIVRELLTEMCASESHSSKKSHDDVLDTAGECLVRVAEVALQLAQSRRGKLTLVDQSAVNENAWAWRSLIPRVAGSYSAVTVEQMSVETCAMFLASDPQRFDVILTSNLAGEGLSGEAAGLTSAPSMLALASLGDGVGLYQPAHNAIGLTRAGGVNPIGAIASAALLLRHSAGLDAEAGDLEAAIRLVLNGGYRTLDLPRGRSRYIVSTSEMGTLVTEAIAEIADRRHAYHAV